MQTYYKTCFIIISNYSYNYVNHERIAMNIEKKTNSLQFGNEYGTYFIIKNDTYIDVVYDDNGNYSHLTKEESVEIFMGEFDEENAPRVSKTLTFAQLKELADFCNQRIANIQASVTK